MYYITYSSDESEQLSAVPYYYLSCLPSESVIQRMMDLSQQVGILMHPIYSFSFLSLGFIFLKNIFNMFIVKIPASKFPSSLQLPF